MVLVACEALPLEHALSAKMEEAKEAYTEERMRRVKLIFQQDWQPFRAVYIASPFAQLSNSLKVIKKRFQRAPRSTKRSRTEQD